MGLPERKQLKINIFKKVNPRRKEVQVISPDVPQVASLTWRTLLKANPSTPQFPRPSLLFQDILSTFWFPSPRKTAPPLAPQIHSRARPPLRCPPRSTTPNPLAKAGLRTPHPDFTPSHSGSRQRLRPRRSPHRTPAPPRNTPPARSPLTAHDAEGTVLGQAEKGWRGRERTHEPLARSASLGAGGKPTRLPRGCDGRSNDSLLGLPG